MQEKADRYTVIPTSLDDLADKLKACSLLQLQFFVRNESGHPNTYLIYIFFDEAGMRNYLKAYVDSYEDEDLAR